MHDDCLHHHCPRCSDALKEAEVMLSTLPADLVAEYDGDPSVYAFKNGLLCS
jgi:hypothetical protein